MDYNDETTPYIGTPGIALPSIDLRPEPEPRNGSEQRLRLMIEKARDIVFQYELSPSQGFKYLSPAVASVFGYTREELYADPNLVFRLVHPEDNYLLESLAEAAPEEDPQMITVRWVHRDGHSVWTQQGIVRIRDEAGKIVGIDGIARDITELELAEEALRQSEARFRAIFEGAAIGIVLVDTRGNLLGGNTALQEMLGYSDPELCSMTVSDYTHPDHRAETERLLTELRSGARDSYQLEKRLVRKDGQVIWGRVTASLARGDGREPQFTVGMIQDITRWKQLEEQLHRAQRLETAGRIAGQVAHDFNNLLGPLVGYPELIKRQLPEEHPAAGYCESMLQAAQQMADINTDMLTLSRRGLLNREAVDLNRLVRQALAMVEGSPPDLVVDAVLAADLLPISGSSAQLLRVLSNLMSNAREAMRDVGALHVRTENCYVDRPFGSYNQVQVGEYVRLDVADSGCGISPEVRDRIFDAFFTTKRTAGRRGTGLGLSVVQAIVADHRGYIDLESEVGRGTTFRVYLPVQRGPVREAAKAAARRGDERILVVDDDDLQREVAAQLLGVLGYQVNSVADGEHAVAYLAEHPVDLVLLDMVMPDSIDGAETFRRILEVRPGQRAIVMSGFAETDRVQQALALGVGSYLRKPLAMEKLAHAVREELERRP